MNKILLRPKEKRRSKQKVKQLVVRPDIHAKLQDFADATGRTLVDVTNEILEQACSAVQTIHND